MTFWQYYWKNTWVLWIFNAITGLFLYFIPWGEGKIWFWIVIGINVIVFTGTLSYYKKNFKRNL